MSRNSKMKENQNWWGEKQKLEHARRLRGIYFIDSEDAEFKENHSQRAETFGLHEHFVLVIPSPPETDNQILERWGFADEDHLGKLFQSECFWPRMFVWCNTAWVNWTLRIGFRMFERFCKIDEDFGGSISWHAWSKCRLSFNKATAPLFFSKPGGVHKTIFSPNLHSFFVLWNTHYCECHFSQDGFVQEPWRWALYDGLRPLGLLVLAGFLKTCGVEDSGEGAGVLPSCRKLHLSPFEHCPLLFHC